ncbi:HpcH/HpaI aldolase/citrate lyase family protein [Salirhabdus sp. Marseille-P4669]|uniref:HpcH/HpaI aldolase/citrate lyase family protein n=1 Tax=Salirhabdus sp. Marseille-P4669 TaxID=2042310 RepID=UPI00135BC0DE|nr:CoA ester lyase [Salirhabdus sp. Marseille-P4669]
MIISWLFVPGSKDKFLSKVKEIKADAFIFDLEDSVAIEEKELARQKVSQAIRNGISENSYIRINGIATKFLYDDLVEVVTPGLKGVFLPKVNTKEDIIILDYLLSCMERQKGMEHGRISIIPIIETATGLRNAYDIASASHRIDRLALGAEDLMFDLNIRSEERKNGMIYARSKLVTDSRAANVDSPIDAIYADFTNDLGLKHDAERGKQLGFQGKLLIHPNQIPIVTDVFMPTAQELKEAKRIVEFYEDAMEKGFGSVQVDGKMVDIPVAERAKRLLSLESLRK